jgi:CheY-like chemotaxis protein
MRAHGFRQKRLAVRSPRSFASCILASFSPLYGWSTDRPLKKSTLPAVNAQELIPLTDPPMPLPIVIADDSLLARKVLTKALPPDWDVDVSYAANGREALGLYREGKASVMFLDLTMPDMTGYQVLEALQHEDLNTFVIVVSADVQPMAQSRVRALGAAAFIAKPVTPEAVLPILKEYGLYV